MAEKHVFDLLPGYALGALDDAELLQVAQHLSGCALCREELAAFQETASRLALSAPSANPPGDLRAKVVARVIDSKRSAEPTAPVMTDAPRAAPQPRPVQPAPATGGWLGWLQSLLGGRAGLAFGIGALALIALLAFSNLLLWRQVNELKARAAPGDGVQVIRLAGTENAPQATGYLMAFQGDPYGSLTVEHAPALEAGKQYQVWLIDDGQRSSGGVFSVDEDGYAVLQINADKPLDLYDSFGITIEPEGGSPGPTGKKVMGGGS